MTLRLFLFSCLTVVALMGSSGTRAMAEEDGAMAVLFIGNSYTGNVRSKFNPLIAAVSPETQVAYKTGGGWTLSRHVGDPRTKESIASRDWDYVVLQEQSRLPTFDTESGMYKEHRRAIRQLVTWICAAGATPVLFQTWGRRDGDRGAPKRSPDFDAMQAHLTRAYADAGRETDAMVVPVGQVWQAVRHADIQLGNALHSKDGSHASEKGSYLAAATFMKALMSVSASPQGDALGMSDKEVATIEKAINDVLGKTP